MAAIKLTHFQLFAIMLTIVFFAAISFAGPWLAISPYNRYKNIKIVALGDSITTGFGSEQGNSYVEHLNRMLGLNIINAGVSGDSILEAKERLEKDVFSENPDVVLVLLGGNDLLKGVPPVIFFNFLSSLIDEIQNRRIKVILIGISQDLFPEYEKQFKKIAEEKKIAGYVPNIFGGIAWRKDLMYDKIHPNDEGQKLMAMKIAPVLMSVLQQVQKEK